MRSAPTGPAGPLARRVRDDSGSAVVEWVLVSALVVLLFLGLVQVAVALHVRAVLVDSAAQGARVAARADSDLNAGQDRTRDLVGAALGTAYAHDVVADHDESAGVRMVRVTVSAPIPVVGLWGLGGALTVHGRAVVEELP